MAVLDTHITDATSTVGPAHHKRRPSSPTSSTSLNHVHIAEALLKSEDNGATLDFSHGNITDVGEYGAEELATIGREDLMKDESSVLRITLASNRLATLPMAFALLSRLRYLNLKSNCLSVFPDVLTVMPSLEILDIGRNKIKRLPSQPGSLVNLRVFSFYKNKITRLPPYLTKFTRLSILRVEQNPLEWPPKAIVDTQANMKDWIKTIQQWIETNTASSEQRAFSADSVHYGRSDTVLRSGNGDTPSPGLETSLDDGPTPHARSFSVSSEISVYPSPEEDRLPSSVAGSSRLAERPSPLHLGSLPPVGANDSSLSLSHSPDTYLPTPAESVSSYEEEDVQQISPDNPLHARNASYAGSSRQHPRSSITGKKSLPDLRPTKLRLGLENEASSSSNPPLWGQLGSSLQANRSIDQFSIPSPLSQRQDSSESSDALSYTARPFAQGHATNSPTSMDRPAPAMDVERNSYFRRFSTVPSSSTLSKIIPESLLHLVDGVRGILFAVSQIYQALQHYTVYAIDERLASVLLKVLDPASAFMTQLINALDRFDSMSRRTLPTPLICRGVIESCKDNVAVFGKAVGVLALQLKVLATRDDVRYTRQMLLMLYGATAEISNAWQSMGPHIEAVQPFLRDHPPPALSKSRPNQPSSHHPLPTSVSASTSLPPTPNMFPRPPTLPLETPLSAGRTHIARRHAGSFSSKDVEIGKSLPSFVEPLPVQGGVAPGTAAETPTPRAALRHVGFFSPSLVPSTPMSSAMAGSNRAFFKGSMSPREAHSRQNSQSSLLGSSTGSSPSVAGRTPMVDAPPEISTLVDKEAIDAMKKAVEAAPSVWSMMETMLVDIPESRDEIKEALSSAQSLTNQLKDSIAALQEDAPVDRKALREDAHAFVKIVVSLSNSMKVYGGSHPMSSVLRTNMVKLTNATEEFVILLHVSSFSSSSTPRPVTPVVNAFSSNGAVLTVDDNRLGSNLSRSRSALSATSKRFALPMVKDMPHSAQPHQTFKVSTPPPHRLGRDDGLDVF
ncbi:hypothetical protein BV25DRAFT_1821826 [Artomyces pyxidatus]|uniref:Uncharacterized protein n=1 Tax=Artomyces pyxidatus TaxID=48021 RepID=A0ACB8T930_9AGAM|nr:hypothetical protein BV25DRAFT_1821826 [Artomyces pyxidatus]